MAWDNLATREVQAQMQARWDEGFVAGIDADPNRLPEWFNKPAMNWGPYQRGWYVGREAKVRGILGDLAK